MEFPFETEVTSVVVYPDRARVTAWGRCELTERYHQIVVGELPLALEPESIRASGKGTARVRIRSVDVQRRHYVHAPAINVTALEQQIDRLQGDLGEIGDRMAVFQASVDHINGMRQATSEYAWGLARGRHTIENQTTLIRFFEVEDARLRGELRELERKQQESKDELAKLQAELDQIQSARPRQRYEARLEIEVLSSGNFEVEVNYIVGRAGWRPLYDMRLIEKVGGEAAVVSVTSLAEVTQNTGQDWSGIRLTVSTARPALNQRVPEINPWFVDELRPQPRVAKYAMAAKGALLESADMAAEEAMPLMASMAPPSMTAAEVDVAEVRESGTAVSFAVSGSVDIPGDGMPKKTIIGQHEFTPRLDFLSIPRHTDAVYRRAKLNNTTGAPMLPGPVSLYVGDEYIGQNRLEYIPVGSEVELVLGVEERITVKREMVRRDVDKRLLRDQRQVIYGYEIKLENLLTSVAVVTVQDQYPVSRHDQIKVKLERVTPEPEEHTDLHLLKWQLELSQNEKRTIEYEYQVEHPRAMKVGGLVD